MRLRFQPPHALVGLDVTVIRCPTLTNEDPYYLVEARGIQFPARASHLVLY